MAPLCLNSVISRATSRQRMVTRCRSSHGQAPNTLRILMLHGFTQSGKQFETKTQTLRNELRHGLLPSLASSKYHDIKFVFPTAPFALKREALPSFDIDGAEKRDKTKDVDAFTWWHIAGEKPPFRYEGLETAMTHIADTIIREGPFDGAMGFSQGTAATAMVASLLENEREEAFEKSNGSIPFPSAFVKNDTVIQPPLKFAVAFSGFGGTRVPMYQGFYDPKITTPILHVLGETDDFIKPSISQDLINACANPKIAHHSGGHAVPKFPGCADEVVDFLRAILTA